MTEEKKTTIKAENYGELLSQVYGMELVKFEEDGGYQGQYLCILLEKKDEWDEKDLNKLFYFIDSYGSCSGCDWLEAEKDWNTGEVPYAKALEYMTQTKPKYIVPESMPLEFENLGNYEGFKLKEL